MVFGDALFARRENALDNQTPAQIVKYVLLLINQGCVDVAYHITTLYPETLKILPSLERFFKKRTYGSLIKRGLWCQYDKLILAMMRLRRTNQMSMDADRSWPFR